MPPDSPTFTYVPLPLRSHLATVMAVMGAALAVGTWMSWLSARVCTTDDVDRYCEPTRPAVAMLVGMGLTMSAALLLGSALLWANLRQRVVEPAA